MLDGRAADYTPEALEFARSEAERRGGRQALAQRVAEAETASHVEPRKAEASADNQDVLETRKVLSQRLHPPAVAFGIFHLQTLHPFVEILATIVLGGALAIGVLVAALSVPRGENAGSTDRQLIALFALGAGFWMARWLMANQVPRLVMALRSGPGAVRWTPWVLLAVTKDAIHVFPARGRAKPKIEGKLGHWPRRGVKASATGTGLPGVELTLPGARHPVELYLVPATESGDPVAHLLDPSLDA